MRLRYLDFICIFMDAIKSELLTFIFQSDIVRIWAHETVTLLLQSERLNKLRFTPPTHQCLSHLPSPTPSHNLSSNRFPKCIRNKGRFIVFTRDWKKNNKKQFPSVEIGNDILIYINIKRVFQIDIDYTRC